MVSTEKTKSEPAQAVAPGNGFYFESIDAYLVEVKRFLLGKNLRDEWVDQIIDGDRHWLEKAFEKKTQPVYAAFEVYITEEESAREPDAADLRLKMEVTDQAKGYLQQLVAIGLWGDSLEAVAATLLHQQLASKLEAGVFKPSTTDNSPD